MADTYLVCGYWLGGNESCVLPARHTAPHRSWQVLTEAPSPDDMSEAWKEAEEALPYGWHLDLIGRHDAYVASAGPDHEPLIVHRSERTVTRALRSLAEALRKVTDHDDYLAES